MDQSTVGISPDARLARCEPQQISVEIPSPLNARLDALVRMADEEGAATSRRELVAALILGAPTSGRRLAAAVIRLRKARAAEAGVPGVPLAEVLELKSHPPGPRPRRSQVG